VEGCLGVTCVPAPAKMINNPTSPPTTPPPTTQPNPTPPVSGVGAELAAFCGRHPDATRDILLFCVCGAVGQLFIFFTIKRFGALVNTLICTTRKFFNILVSVLLVGNPLLPAQWVAVGLVFGGLIASSVAKTGGHGGQKHGGGEVKGGKGKKGAKAQ
jgi:hypothetical protein